MTTELTVLTEFIKNEMGYDGDIDPDVDLLEMKILDSFSIVKIAVFIQERFDVELEADDLVRVNLAKLSSMLALIDKRRAANPEAPV